MAKCGELLHCLSAALTARLKVLQDAYRFDRFSTTNSISDSAVCIVCSSEVAPDKTLSTITEIDAQLLSSCRRVVNVLIERKFFSWLHDQYQSVAIVFDNVKDFVLQINLQSGTNQRNLHTAKEFKPQLQIYLTRAGKIDDIDFRIDETPIQNDVEPISQRRQPTRLQRLLRRLRRV